MTWGYFKIGKFHKNKRDETIQKAALGSLEVVLTTYETLRNHWVRGHCLCACLSSKNVICSDFLGAAGYYVVQFQF